MITRSKTNKADDKERRQLLEQTTAKGVAWTYGQETPFVDDRPKRTGTIPKNSRTGGAVEKDTDTTRPVTNADARANHTHIISYGQPASPSEEQAKGAKRKTEKQPTERSEHPNAIIEQPAGNKPATTGGGVAATGGAPASDGGPREDRGGGTGARAQPAPSIRSHASSTAARKREAELRALERLADIERELTKKKLALELQMIEETSLSSRASSPLEPLIDLTTKVDEWFSQAEQGNDNEDAARRPGGRQIHAGEMPLAPLRGERALSPPRGPCISNQAPLPDRREHNERTRSPRRYREQSPVEPRAASPRRRFESTPLRTEPRGQELRSSAEPSSDAATAFNRLAEQLKETMRPKPPKQVYELPYYNGDPNEWLLFYNAYRETTARYGFSSYENMARLRNCLKGDAKQCVQHLLATSRQPDLVIRLLKKNFGRTDLLIDRALDELKRLPSVGPSAIDLNTFSTKVVNIVGTLIDLDGKNYADNPLLTREITERLSPHLRSKWCQFAREQIGHQGCGELQLLANFLLEKSEAELEYSHAKAPTRRYVSHNGPPRPEHRPGAPARGKPPIHRTYAVEKQDPCLCCGGSHRTPDCKKVLDMNIGARWDWARINRVCFRCLNKKHRRDQCRARGCGIEGCPHTHHRLLHEVKTQRTQTTPARTEPLRQNQREPEPRAEQSCMSDVHAAHVGTTVLLKVIPIKIEGPNKSVDTFALMDEGSTVTLADEDLIREIGAVGMEEPLRIQGVGTMATSNDKSQRVEVLIRGKNNGAPQRISVRTVRALGLRGQYLNGLTKYAHLSDLQDACYEKAVPRMLIGADNWHLMMPLETRAGKRNEPAAVKTQLGWVIFGTAPRTKAWRGSETALHCRLEDREINGMLKDYFSLDSLGVKNVEKKKPEDERAIRIFEETVRKVNMDGPRYEVGQIWRTDDPKLPPSYGTALTRLRSIERKMDKDPEFAASYTSQVNNLLEKKYAVRVTEPPEGNKTWFLPHFPVTNLNKPGKVRLVFDAACTCQGVSLNDFILEGPDLLQSLLGILFRFREGKFAVVADLQEMFLQIKLKEEDQPSQLFLWRGTDRQGPPQIYKMTSILFGASSSPFIAHSVRNRNAQDNAEQYPASVPEITRNHYMDDFVSSFSNENELINSASQVAASHEIGGFRLRGWTSNSHKLLERIPEELRANVPAQLGNKESKILGLMWNPEDDTLGFNTKMIKVPQEVKEFKKAPTKRQMLSAVMSVYDPLGLLSHYTITAKLQLQKLWSLKSEWDAPLPEDLRKEFDRWLRALEDVAELRIPRPYTEPGPDPNRQLHIFTDASMKAYSCVAYWRNEKQGKIDVTLIAAKAKVAPVKQLSVPRLELQAALIGARLADEIKKHHRYDRSEVFMWTDSRTVLHWVRNSSKRYSTYVAHRLGEIAERTKVEDWRWIPTKLNPADQATRPDLNRKIEYNSVWYKGPEFLTKPESEWPVENSTHDKRLLELEEQAYVIDVKIKVNEVPLPELSRFSSYDRLINATARVFQFIERIKTKTSVEFQVKHRAAAEHLWFQWAQRLDFADELLSLSRGETISKKSRIYGLDPVLDVDGLLKMRGRINAAPVQGLDKRPVILDGHNKLVRLLILQAHRGAAHANNETVINNLRQRYWILHLRPTVRNVAHNCQLCKIRRAQPSVPVMGDLPLARIEPYKRAFTNSAVDLFGPVTVTIGRRHEKRWVALFTCLTTRAVHLEIVHSLTTDSAIMALRRLAARRGWPAVMYSDNATNFRGADLELRNAYAEWLPALKNYGVRHNMVWRFIPPGAPNQGGAWERLVRSVKTVLAATLHTKAPREEVLQTLLVEAENIINARPLTHVSVDHRDEEALTPSHFLLGGSTGLPPTGPCHEADRRAWRASQALADHFWRRWVREYLPMLAPRKSSADQTRPLQPGDCVIVADPNLPRNTWPRGIVRRVFPGPDGNVRSADIETRGGVFRRPVTRLAVLPVQRTDCAQAAGGECCGQPRNA